MGHRRLINTSQVFEGEHEQSWNDMHPELSYTNAVRTVAAENTLFVSPVENVSADSLHFSSHWNPLSRSNGFPVQNVEAPHHQPDASGPSHDLFLHPSASGAFSVASENYSHHPSSSNYDRQNFDGLEGGIVDLTVGNARGHHKRKSPGIPSACEQGSSSRYFNAGSSSDFPLPSEFRQEKPIDSQHMHWDRFGMNQSYRSNGLSIRGEVIRNVRSRTVFDLESNLVRNHVASNPSQTSHPTSHPGEHSASVDITSQSSSSLTRDWGHFQMSPVHGRIQAPDSSTFNYETNHFVGGTAMPNGSVDVGCLQHDFLSVRSSVGPQSFHGFSTPSARSMRSNFPQRSCPTFRASSSTGVRSGHVAHIDDGIQLPAENYSRHPRPLSVVSWRNCERNGRPRMSNDRYRSVSDDAAFHEQFTSEDFTTADRAAFYGARSMFDHHRDMRLDIDNMTYEELLALGERIGSVSTGLSEDLITKCLTETRHYSSNQSRVEGHCVICLEEYGDMHEIGTIKVCGHDYHVDCIKKWLSLKNMCPICKASAVDDGMKGKQ